MAKLPSGRFPFINLSKALDRAQAIYDNDKGGKGLKVPVAFAAWGYSDKSSGGFQTIAALKGYGLLGDEGANDDRAVKLTQDARRYFQTEIESDQASLRDGFALHPPLMNHLFELWDGGTVDDPVARTYLKTSIGMNEQSARSALGIYKDNLSFILDKGSSKTVDESGEISVQEDETDHEVLSTPPTPAAPKTPTSLRQVEAVAVAAPELRLLRTVAGGYVIHLSGAIMNKNHADEAIELITALKNALPDAPEQSAPPSTDAHF